MPEREAPAPESQAAGGPVKMIIEPSRDEDKRCGSGLRPAR